MTTQPSHRREYLPRPINMLVFLIPAVVLALVAAKLVYDIATDDGVPVIVPVAVGALFVALFAGLGALAYRAPKTATLCDERQVTIRGLFGTRTTAWPDIQGIELEKVKAGGMQPEGAPRRGVALYERTGRRRWLPVLTDRTCDDLEQEVAILQEIWLRRRGENWRPEPEVAARIAARRERSR